MSIYSYNQFITYKLIQKPGKPKADKVPWDASILAANQGYHTGQGWMSYNDALMCAAQNGLGVGFVFTRQDPFCFIDLDNCADGNGNWTPFALSVLNMFPGAMVERSISGVGLHVIAHGSAPEGHRTQDKARGMEVYTHSRFVALGMDAVGDSSTECGTGLAALIASMPEPTIAGLTVPWTTESDPEWSGPEDDDELIKRMLGSKPSIKAAMGGGCTIKQLWEADPAALSITFPDPGDRPFDWSSADASLIAHLTWWTGKNSERIDRLFRRSKLFREDKWAGRPDYVKRTIGGAITACRSVYIQGSGKSDIISDVLTVPKLGTMWADQQEEYFKGCAYVRSQHRIFVPDTGDLLKPDTFKAYYGGYFFAMDQHNTKPTKSAFECFTESKLFRFPKVHNICFRPELKPGSIISYEGRQLINTYIPIDVEVSNESVDPFLNHMLKLFPDDRDRTIIISYMAAVIQYPGVKFQWCPLVQGVMGNGKTFIVTAIVRAIGENHTHLPNVKELGDSGGKFNHWLEGKIFIGLEEIYVHDRRDMIDTLNIMITNSRMEFQAKGGDQHTGDNRANFWALTNHKEAVIITEANRRWAPFYTPQQFKEDITRDGMGGNYFPDLYKWAEQGGYAAITGYLRHFKIAEWCNPATLCHRAPETTSTADAIKESMGPLEQEILEQIYGNASGFRSGWVSSEKLQEFLTKGLNRRISPRARAKIIETLGYIKHPYLKEGRLSNPVIAENLKRPVLYVKKDTPQSQIEDPVMIRKMYCEAQGYQGEIMPVESSVVKI